MRRSILFVLLAAIFGIISCRRTIVIPLPTPSVIGQWEWVKQTNILAFNGIYYDTLTSQSTGISGLLNMNQDSSWQWMVNGQTVDQGTFDIDPKLTPEGPIPFLIFNGSNDRFLTFIGSPGQDSVVNHSISFNNDTLYISNTLDSGRLAMNTFVRENTKY